MVFPRPASLPPHEAALTALDSEAANSQAGMFAVGRGSAGGVPRFRSAASWRIVLRLCYCQKPDNPTSSHPTLHCHTFLSLFFASSSSSFANPAATTPTPHRSTS
jgi:hypothetical protein